VVGGRVREKKRREKERETAKERRERENEGETETESKRIDTWWFVPTFDFNLWLSVCGVSRKFLKT